MADRKFTVVNGSKPQIPQKPTKPSHHREWILAIILILVCITLVGLAVALGRETNILEKGKSKRQTTCLTWEEEGKPQLQCGSKLYVEKSK